jgi:hypothetical protein
LSGAGKKKSSKPTASVEGAAGFKNCSGCAEIIKKGGVIKGLMVENGRVRGLIADFNARQDTQVIQTMPAASKPSIGVASSQNAPYIQIVGTVAIAGQTTALKGDTVTVYGRNFCGGTDCSSVGISIGERVITQDVKVKQNGKFSLTFVVTEPPGQYTVRAHQTSGDRKLADAGLLNVSVRERR